VDSSESLTRPDRHALKQHAEALNGLAEIDPHCAERPGIGFPRRKSLFAVQTTGTRASVSILAELLDTFRSTFWAAHDSELSPVWGDLLESGSQGGFWLIAGF
jgi:hypothetical protein